MVIVPSDDRRAPRVGPKVFADVPSSAELLSTQAELQSVKRSRSGMLVFTVLLLGLLIAAAFAAFMLFQQSQAHTTVLNEANARTEAAEQELAEYRAQVAEDFGEFQTLNDKRARTRAIRAEIAAVIARYPRAQDRLRPDGDYLRYQTAGGTWEGETRAVAENRLDSELERLGAELNAVRAYRPPVIPGTPTTPSTPSTPSAPSRPNP